MVRSFPPPPHHHLMLVLRLSLPSFLSQTCMHGRTLNSIQLTMTIPYIGCIIGPYTSLCINLCSYPYSSLLTLQQPLLYPLRPRCQFSAAHKLSEAWIAASYILCHLSCTTLHPSILSSDIHHFIPLDRGPNIAGTVVSTRHLSCRRKLSTASLSSTGKRSRGRGWWRTRGATLPACSCPCVRCCQLGSWRRRTSSLMPSQRSVAQVGEPSTEAAIVW